MSQWQMIKMLRQQLDVKQMAEDMAEFVIEDLKEEGFDAKLVKHNPKKPKTWKIISVNMLNDEDQERFDKIKEEQVTFYRDNKISQIKDIKKGIIG